MNQLHLGKKISFLFITMILIILTGCEQVTNRSTEQKLTAQYLDTLTASDGSSNDNFGSSLSLSSDGSTALFGSYYDDENGTDSDAAKLYSISD